MEMKGKKHSRIITGVGINEMSKAEMKALISMPAILHPQDWLGHQ